MWVDSTDVSGVCTVTVSNVYEQYFPENSYYAWDETTSNSYKLTNLIPGEVYYVRVSARNDLGYGVKRLTAPPYLTVPVTQPTTPTLYEGDRDAPKVYRATSTSLVVKIGTPSFDGGSLLTNYVVEWDTSPDFNSGASNTVLGSATIAAHESLCPYDTTVSCVSDVTFNHDDSVDDSVYIWYQGNANSVRQLQAGKRITVVTTDDAKPYTFTVKDESATKNRIRVVDQGTRELVFNATSGNTPEAQLYMMGTQYEIVGLTEGQIYYVRVRAENTPGVCTGDAMAYIDECGAYVATSPSSAMPEKAPDAPPSISTRVMSENSIEVSWLEPSSSSPVSSYRVDAYTKSSVSSAYSSFFGDTEVQKVDSTASNVTGGTFTLAYDSYDVELPGTVSGLNNDYEFTTTSDLASYLEPGDGIYVDGKAYTIAASSVSTAQKIFVNEPIQASNANADLINVAVHARPKTLPIPYDVTPLKLIEMLENTPSMGQVHVERFEGSSTGFSWHVTFVTNVGDQPAMIVNNLQLLGSNNTNDDPTITLTTSHDGVAPNNYQYVTVPANNSASMTTTTFFALTSGTEYYFRVVATNAVGDGPFSPVESATPAATPLGVSALTISPHSGSKVKATFTHDANSRGAEITHFNLNVSTSSGVTRSLEITANNQVQKVFTSAHTLPFTADSTFTLSLDNY
jgi:hypothetical protein